MPCGYEYFAAVCRIHAIRSKQMDTLKLGVELPSTIELYRIRVESWRVVYVVEEELQLLTVLTVRKRPPYQYDNLRELLLEAIANEEE